MKSFPWAARQWLVALLVVSPVWVAGSRLNAAPPAHPAHWMQDISDQIGGVPLRGIAMPGTHDAAMYKGMADGDIAKTQTGDFTAQLNAGARWLDFRFLYLDNTTCSSVVTGSETLHTTPHTGFYMDGHSARCINILVSDALTQIGTFLQNHPQEIITLLMVQNGNKLTADQIAAFQQMVAQILVNPATGQSYIYNDQVACTLGGGEWQGNGPCDDPLAPISPQNVTPNQLWSTPARVILLQTDSSLAGPLIGSWLDANVEVQGGYNDASGGTSNPEYEVFWLDHGTPAGAPGLYPTHPAYANWTSDPKMLYLSACLTPFGSPSSILGGVSPIYESDVFNPLLTQVIQNTVTSTEQQIYAPDLSPSDLNWLPYVVNVVELDNITVGGTAAAVIAINDQQWPALNSGPNGTSELASGGGFTYKLESATLPGSDPELDVWNDNGQGWSQVTRLGSFAQTGARVAVDPTGNPWVVSSSGVISRQLSPSNWTTVSGLQATDIGIGSNGTVWAIGPANVPYLYNSTAQTWTPYAGVAASHIAVDNSGNPWVVTTAGVIYNLPAGSSAPPAGQNAAWQSISAPFAPSAIAIGPGNAVWALGPNVYQYNGSGWTEYKNGGVALSVDYAGSPWVADGLGRLFKGKLRGVLPDPLSLETVASQPTNLGRGLWTSTVTVTNTSTTALSGPFYLVPVALTNGTGNKVPVLNATGQFHGFPYVALPDSTLQPGESTLVALAFHSAAPTPIYFDPKVFLGTK